MDIFYNYCYKISWQCILSSNGQSKWCTERKGFWRREQQSLGVWCHVGAYLNCPRYSLPFGQKPISWKNFLQCVWLCFQLFSGVVRQCRLSRGKRLICCLMQLNSICQAILFYMPLKRLGNLKEDEGNKCIPRSGFKGRSVLEFRAVLLAADHQERPCYIFLPFLKSVPLWPVSEKDFLSHL